MTLLREGNLAITGAMTTAKVTNIKELVLEQTGDQYGPTRVRLQNRTDKNGVQIDTTGSPVPICDLEYITSTGQMQTRFKSSGAAIVDSANTGGEMVWIQTTSGNLFSIGSHKVTSVKPFTAKAGMRVEGDLTVTGGITGGVQTQLLSGAWTNAFNNAAATIKVTRTLNIIHLTFGMFSAFPISASAQAVYNAGLPSWARPDADVSVITFTVSFAGGTEPNYISVVIQQNGAIALKPPNKFDVNSVVGFTDGYKVVSYPVSA
jgi:hypothetical protein